MAGKFHSSPPTDFGPFDHRDRGSLPPPLMQRTNQYNHPRVFEAQSNHYKKKGVLWRRIKKWFSLLSLIIGLIIAAYLWRGNFVSFIFSTKLAQRKIIVQAVPENYNYERVQTFSAMLSLSDFWEYRIFTPDERVKFLKQFGSSCMNTDVDSIIQQYHALPHELLRIEMWKHCILATGLAQGYIDYNQVHVLDDTNKLLDFSATVMIRLKAGNEDTAPKYMVNTALIINYEKSQILASRKMLSLIVDSPIFTGKSERTSSLLLGYEFYKEIQHSLEIEWLEIKCQNLAQTSSRNLHSEPIRFINHAELNTSSTLCFLQSTFCPNSAKSPCCQVFTPESPFIWFLLQHPLMASDDVDNDSRQAFLLQNSPEQHLATVKQEELEFISVVIPSDVEISPNVENDAYQSMTPNFFQLLLENECLPTQKECHRCLQRPTPEGKSADCDVCAKECGCYCSVLCKLRPLPKRVAHRFLVQPPKLRKDTHRLIPKLVHQTWFEDVHPSKYPNMSRLMESWKTSGWEYHFYDDDTIAQFLEEHFPPQIKEAYDAILPGAFKADLFRYCLLLIRGGVYADMDVLLQSNLDEVIADDIGFMVPIDEPGVKVNRRSCLWNGLIAVAPGHPFIAQTIETVVNNIRNRFTSVDYDDMLCPNPVMHVSHTVDTLFTCGPCIMGASLNKVLGRHLQTQFEVGEIDLWQVEQGRNANSNYIEVHSSDVRLSIPGRSIILKQNKKDMGAHRFTFEEKNLLVAATDMPDYDDRPPTLEHYSKTHRKSGVYGVKKLYKDLISANELIEIAIENQVT